MPMKLCSPFYFSGGNHFFYLEINLVFFGTTLLGLRRYNPFYTPGIRDFLDVHLGTV